MVTLHDFTIYREKILWLESWRTLFLATFRNIFSTIASSFTYPAALEADRDVAFYAEHISPRFRIPPSDTLTGTGAAGVIGGY